MTIRTAAPNKDRRSASKVLPARAPKPPALPCTGLHCLHTDRYPCSPGTRGPDFRARARAGHQDHQGQVPRNVFFFVWNDYHLSFPLFFWMTKVILKVIYPKYVLFLSWLGRQASTENVSNFEKVFMCKADRKFEFLYIVASPLKPNYFKKQCSLSSFLLT